MRVPTPHSKAYTGSFHCHNNFSLEVGFSNVLGMMSPSLGTLHPTSPLVGQTSCLTAA